VTARWPRPTKARRPTRAEAETGIDGDDSAGHLEQVATRYTDPDRDPRILAGLWQATVALTSRSQPDMPDRARGPTRARRCGGRSTRPQSCRTQRAAWGSTGPTTTEWGPRRWPTTTPCDPVGRAGNAYGQSSSTTKLGRKVRPGGKPSARAPNAPGLPGGLGYGARPRKLPAARCSRTRASLGATVREGTSDPRPRAGRADHRCSTAADCAVDLPADEVRTHGDEF